VSTRILTIAVLAGIGLALAVLGRWPRSTVPTLGELLDRLTSRPAGRVTALVIWVWVGWHFFGR
jgi:uncharacterized protein DUF6186